MRNATTSPLERSIARLRVPPCENSDFGISIHGRAVAAGDVERAVGRARVDDQQLDGDPMRWRADRAEDLVELGGAVQYGDRDRDGPDRHRRANAPLTFFESQRTTSIPKRSGEVRRHESECS